MGKPLKPNINIPAEFAPNGAKANFTAEKLLNGFDEVEPDTLAGDNLNKFIDDVYKALNYTIECVDTATRKEIYINPEFTAEEDGTFSWTINHTLGTKDIVARLYSHPGNVLLWGEPKEITETTVKYVCKHPAEAGIKKAVLIG